MILEMLKNQTAESHVGLERNSFLQPLNNPTVTKRQYLTILNVFYGFYKPIEDNLDTFATIREYLPDYESRRKAEDIITDIHFLNSAYSKEDSPLCDDLPQMNNSAQAFGVLYVLEGSTLGGRIISRNLSKNLGLEPDTGALFFNGYQGDTGPKWKLFQQALLAYTEVYPDHAEIVAAANETFDKLNSWITNRNYAFK